MIMVFIMFKLLKFFSLCILFCTTVIAQAQQVNVDALRYKTRNNASRLVFDLSKKTPSHVFLLSNPPRLVIDFKKTRTIKPLTQPPKGHPQFKHLRSAVRNKKDFRVVIDLKKPAKSNNFYLLPNKSRGHRLVVDLTNNGIEISKTAPKVKKIVKQTIKNKTRDIIVAVDAGHGGKDPGAEGPNGTKEKRVVFAISKKLVDLINRQPGMKAIMVRKSDRKIKLRQRMEIARAANADLFISIHADAVKRSTARGASVYTLSTGGATSEAAKLLAKHENSVDSVAGFIPAGTEDVVASVLLDLSQSASSSASKNVAKSILKHFKSIGHLHKNEVQKAGFMVLKSPNIPSVLVETAFISNPAEERKLKSSKHQSKMAKAIFEGVVDYFEKYAAVDTYFALNFNKTHTISRGETLSEIALQYGVSMRAIKSANKLASSRVKIGQVLEIPRG